MGLILVSSNGDDEIEYTTVLTPRQRELLVAMLATMADDGYDDIEAFAGRPITDTDDVQLFDLLPKLMWAQEVDWRRQFARAFDDLASDLENDDLPTPSCTAEEMALHLALDRAEAFHADGEGQHLVGHLPTQPADRNWDRLRQDLFQDHDVLMLFDMVDAPDRDGEYALIRPENWFTPFGESARDPGRGFRR